MRNKIGIASSLLTAVLGMLLIIFGTRTQVAVFVDGKPTVFYTHAITIGNALAAGGISYSSSDRVMPSLASFLPASGIIQLNRTHSINVIIEPGGTTLNLASAELIPGNILLKTGVLLFPDDRILFNGEQVDPAKSLPFTGAYTLQFRRAQPVTVIENGINHTFYSSAFTIGQVLSENSIYPGVNDAISQSASASLNGPVSVEIQPAPLVEIEANGKTFSFHTRALTVGGALAEAGISLQYLDTSTPPENAPIPIDGKIKVTSISEQLVFQQTTTQFGIDYIDDPNIELDQTSIVTPGQYGLSISRQRIRTENGREISRVSDAAWQVAQPVNQQVGHGTKIVLRTLDTPNGPVQYWRTATVYVTSYAPCPYGIPPCLYGSSSGMPVQYGLIAAKISWYKAMKYQQLYVPGYGIGTIGDVGGGFPDGRYWIDVAYSNETYVPWGQWVTVYFLAPVPAWYPKILP
jgi:uncharacterized protein YabE (DUF348 family)